MTPIATQLGLGAAAVLLVGASLLGCSDDDRVCFSSSGRQEPGAVFMDGCRQCTCNEDTSITCVATEACDTGCEDEGGQAHDVGTFWPAGDGCNVCQCVATDEVSCTMNACGVPCTYLGTQRAPGTSFASIDGCNTCECLSDGTVSCTEEACACDAAAEWWRDYVATSTAECAVIDYSCPPNTTGFENACGCGCEQSHACAESYDCAPPKSCDVQQLAADCPFSTIVE